MISEDPVPAALLPSAATADQAFFDRYVDLVPSGLVLGLPTFQAFDSVSRKLVILQCFRSPWDAKALDRAIQFGKLKSPFAMRVKDLVQRPTETILVTNLLGLSIEEWAGSEAVSEKDIERMAHQIGDWMMDWKAIHGREVSVGCDTVRIARTEAGRPYCRILGGESVTSSAEAVSSMRSLIGSVLMWNQQRRQERTAPDTSRQFNEDSSLNDLEVDPKSWLGWLLADHPGFRPPSVGDWLLGENPEYRNETIRRSAHHELAPGSPWAELNP